MPRLSPRTWWRCALLLLLVPAAKAQPGPDALRISADGRRFVQADGTPFIYVGDTAWELFHRLDREEADYYLEDRARKGFNVIQAVALAEFDGLTEPNPFGDLPLFDNDPTRPNDAYFRHVDYIVDRAASLGMYVGMLPTWGDKWNKKWGIGPEIFTPENARVYGEYIGSRYRDKPVIWILGGDRNIESDAHLAIIRAMAEGIEAGTGGAQLMTYHPQGGGHSATWFHDDTWLDFNTFQSGHSDWDMENDGKTDADYARTPAKPVIDLEPRYEDHPVDWDPVNGWFTDFDARQAAYWSVLAGAAGHTYGNHNIWQMLDTDRAPISSARTPWREAVHQPGAAQMGYMRRLFASRPFLDLVPDQAVVKSGTGDGPARIRAARSREGSYAIAYTPYGGSITLDLDQISGEQVRAWWFDPRAGMAREIGLFPGTGTRTFDAPGREERGNDWVLVVEDAAAGFSAPGALQ